LARLSGWIALWATSQVERPVVHRSGVLADKIELDRKRALLSAQAVETEAAVNGLSD
jgi:hypothetical protein